MSTLSRVVALIDAAEDELRGCTNDYAGDVATIAELRELALQLRRYAIAILDFKERHPKEECKR